MSNFPCSLTRNTTSHSMENLTFHSLLRWKMIILQILATSLIHFLFERLGECTFLSSGVKGLTVQKAIINSYLSSEVIVLPYPYKPQLPTICSKMASCSKCQLLSFSCDLTISTLMNFSWQQIVKLHSPIRDRTWYSFILYQTAGLHVVQ